MSAVSEMNYLRNRTDTSGYDDRVSHSWTSIPDKGKRWIR